MSETVTAAADAAGVQQPAPTPAAPEAPVVEQRAPERAPTVDETMSAAYDAAMGPERDPEGRFTGDKNAAQQPEAAAPPAPPEGWADAAKVDWKRLPRSVQDEILSRATAIPSAPAPDTLAEAVRPLRAAFESRGLVPEQHLPNIVRAWDELVKNPREVLPELARRFNVEWGAPQGRQATQQEPAAQNEWKAPEVVALEKQVAELAEWKAAQVRDAEQARAAADWQLNQSVNSQLAEFAKDPKHADFDKVRGQMAALMQSGQAKDLAEAYEMASWANPQTRAARIAAEQQAAQAKLEAERKAAVEKARSGAAVNVRSDPSANPAPARSIEESLARAYDRATSA